MLKPLFVCFHLIALRPHSIFIRCMNKHQHHEITSARPPTKLGQTHRIYEVRPRERRRAGQPSTSDQPAPNGRLSAPQQKQWDDTSALRAKKIRDGKFCTQPDSSQSCSCPSGLSVSSQKVLDDVCRTESVGLSGADGGDESEWMDCADSGVPMDSEITVSAKGDEVTMLLETVGMCVVQLCYSAIKVDWLQLSQTA